MNVEKWINELQIAVADLARKIRDAAASAFAPDITTPSEGQLLIYDATAEKWVNGDAPEQYTISAGTELPASPEHEGDIFFLTTDQNTVSAIYTALDISDTLTWVEATAGEPSYGTTFNAYLAGAVGCVILISQDNITAFRSTTIRLRSGSGTFISYAITDQGFPADAFDTFSITYSFQSASVHQSYDLTTLNLTAGHKYNFGVYYRTDAGGCYAGLIYSDVLTPQNFQYVQISHGTGASGDIDISEMTLVKTTTEQTKKKTTKKGGTK